MNKDYLEDAQGRQVPLSIIKPMDLKRHEAVMSIMKETFAERERLIEFKHGIWLRVQDFLAESAKESGSRKFGCGRRRTQFEKRNGFPPARDFA